MDNTEKKQVNLQRLGFIIGFIGLLAVAFSITLSAYKDYREFSDTISLVGWSIAGLGVLVLMIAHRHDLKRFLSSRQAKYGSNAFILTISVIGIVCLVNYMVHRYNVRWDLTQNKTFSLSEQTIKILSNLDDEVKITLFFGVQNSAKQQVIDLIGNYKYYAGDNLSYEVVDPFRSPGKARQYEVKFDGTTILEFGKKKKSITGTAEQDFTSALLNITKDSIPKIYFLQGHGELDPDGFDQMKGMSSLKQLLEKENYVTEKLYLIEKKVIPSDARVLVVAGPQKPLLSVERDQIKKFIDQGGKALVLLSPQVTTGLESMLATYGVKLGNNLVIDPASNFWGGDALSPAVRNYKYHEITKDLKAFTIFPRARSVNLEKKLPDGITGTELAQTSPQSWGETDLKELRKIKRDQADMGGPLSLAVSLKKEVKSPEKKDDKKDDKDNKDKKDDKAKETRLVVIGNTLFAANAMSKAPGNSDFFMNTVAWLAQEEDLISIRAKAPDQRQIELTNQQLGFIRNVSIFVIPALVLILGFFVWWQRR